MFYNASAMFSHVTAVNATKRMLGSNAGAIFYDSDPDATKLEYGLCVLIKKKSQFIFCLATI